MFTHTIDVHFVNHVYLLHVGWVILYDLLLKTKSR